MSKVMLGYLHTKALLLPLDKLKMVQRGLVRDMMEYQLISYVFSENPTVEEIAYHLCEDIEFIRELWNDRTQFAWAHAKRYLDTLIDERKEFQEEKVAAGNASAEARKSRVSLQEAEQILGPNVSVYNALVEHWNHKKVTSDDCHTIKQITEKGKASAQQLITAIISIAAQTPTDKRDYMKSVSSWLGSGGWVVRNVKSSKETLQPSHLNRANSEAGSAYLDNRSSERSAGSAL
jgi:hypothetical protein